MTQTAKQKAEELVNSFLQAINYKNDEGKLIIHQEPYTSAKQCAIICVEEIIKQLEKDAKPEYTSYITRPAIFVAGGVSEIAEVADGYEIVDYWEQVKTEIEAL